MCHFVLSRTELYFISFFRQYRLQMTALCLKSTIQLNHVHETFKNLLLIGFENNMVDHEALPGSELTKLLNKSSHGLKQQ